MEILFIAVPKRRKMILGPLGLNAGDYSRLLGYCIFFFVVVLRGCLNVLIIYHWSAWPVINCKFQTYLYMARIWKWKEKRILRAIDNSLKLAFRIFADRQPIQDACVILQLKNYETNLFLSCHLLFCFIEFLKSIFYGQPGT